MLYTQDNFKRHLLSIKPLWQTFLPIFSRSAELLFRPLLHFPIPQPFLASAAGLIFLPLYSALGKGHRQAAYESRVGEQVRQS
jgi:hypothetical protein